MPVLVCGLLDIGKAGRAVVRLLVFMERADAEQGRSQGQVQRDIIFHAGFQLRATDGGSVVG
jgi:hypothetical protein